jgi:PKD repeat protein
MKLFTQLLIFAGLLSLLSCNLDKVEEPTDCPTPPNAVFTPDKTTGNAPLTVLFGNSSSGATTYSWSFGDGNTSTSTSPSHTFNTAGTYTVKLIASKGDCKDSTSVTITVNATGPMPTAGFTITNGGCIASCQVTFTNTSSDATAFEWDFGDGTAISTQVNPSHTFTAPGDYFVKLTATNAGGGIDTETKPVTIEARKFITNFGGALYDNGNGILQNSDKSYTIIGETNSLGAGYDDIYLLKIDETGANVLLETTFGGSFWDSGLDIIATSDNNYVITGSLSINSNNEDIFLRKITQNGSEIWQRTYGGLNSDKGIRVKETADGGFIILGITYSAGAGEGDFTLIKTDAFGIKTWEKQYGTANDELALALELTSDGGYALLGLSFGVDLASSGAFFVKTDANGNESFSPIKFPNTYIGTSINQTTDGGYIMTIAVFDAFNEADTKMIKINNVGGIVWEKLIASGTGSDYLYGTELSSGEFILTGYTSSHGTVNKDVLLVKTTKDGDEIWRKTFGSTADDEAVEVIQTADGGFILVGSTSQTGTDNVYIIKTDKDGNAQ